MQLKAAISSFFLEFSRFEMPVLGMALRSLSKDVVFVEQAEKLLDLEARFTLLSRMSAARGVPPALSRQLEVILARARELRERRDEIARNLMAADYDRVKPNLAVARKLAATKSRHADYARLAHLSDLWLPGASQIQYYAAQAVELQVALTDVARKLDQHLVTDDPGQG